MGYAGAKEKRSLGLGKVEPRSLPAHHHGGTKSVTSDQEKKTRGTRGKRVTRGMKGPA
jgi:hypothetical protein